MMAAKLSIVLACLMGLSGVALLAAGAHVNAATSVQTAGQFLLFHAPVILVAVALRQTGVVNVSLAMGAIALLIIGTSLFSGDLALRAFADHSLFRLAAPSGGVAIMLGWLALALSALVPSRA